MLVNIKNFIIEQLDKTNEALLAYVGELKRMRKFLLDAGGSADNDEEQIQCQ